MMIDDLNLYYGQFHALKDISLNIQEKEITAFIGPSGCGKSTLLKSLNRMNDLVEGCKITGQVTLDGTDIYRDLDVNLLRKRVGMVFQKPNPFPMSIYDNVAYGPRTHGIRSKAKLDQIVEEALRGAAIWDELKDRLKKSALGLSGGQQQRIAIARAIVNEPRILLLDEPLSALDYKMRQEMQIELKNMHKELGITFIFVTHDQEEALMMSDKIVVMSKGQIQQVGTPEEIYNKPQNAFVADFIGESNIFDGMKKEGNLIHFAHHDFVCHDDHEPGTRLDVVIRPEDVVLTAPDKGKFTGEVISCLFCGKFYEVAVLSDKNEIEAHILHELTPGTKVGVDFTADTIHTMPKDLKVNHYIGIIDKDGWLELTDGRIPVKEKEPKAHPEGTRLKMYFPSKLAKLSDDPEEGYFQGNIISIIYKGDHYNYRVLSENKVEYSVDDEDLWNIGDFVSVVVPEDAMVFESVSEDAE
jgi:spermidine/putrescine transport system ATP-binding protein